MSSLEEACTFELGQTGSIPRTQPKHMQLAAVSVNLGTGNPGAKYLAETEIKSKEK